MSSDYHAVERFAALLPLAGAELHALQELIEAT